MPSPSRAAASCAERAGGRHGCRAGGSLHVLLEVLQRLAGIGCRVDSVGGTTCIAWAGGPPGLLDVGERLSVIGDRDPLARAGAHRNSKNLYICIDELQ